MSDQDRAFHGALTDDATGAKAWALSLEQARAAADAAEVPLRMPTRATALGLLKVASVVLSHRDAVAARLDVESGERGAVVAAVDALPRLGHALLHGLGLLRDGVQTDALGEAQAEGEELRARGFEALELLVSLGTVPREVAGQLRQGRGRVDLAEDLQALSRTLETHWPTLETLQALRPEAQRWTRDELARMAQVGTRLIALLTQPPEAPEHRRDVLGLAAVAEAAYITARAATLYHAERAGLALELPRFGGLRSVAP